MTPPATDRGRKLRAYYVAVAALSGGLAACLIASIWVKDSVGLLVGLYVPFGTGVGAALGLFVNGNVKVHQAKAEGA